VMEVGKLCACRGSESWEEGGKGEEEVRDEEVREEKERARSVDE